MNTLALSVLLLLATGVVAPAAAQAPTPGDPYCPNGREGDGCAIPPELLAQVRDAARYGRAMRNHDLAAWKTTDALRDGGAFAREGIVPRGWLTTESGPVIRVRYFAEVDFDTLAIARADFSPATGRVADAKTLDPPERPDARDMAMLRARDKAVAIDALRCSGNINTIVLPDEHSGREAFRVYVLSAWTGGAMVFGGHHRVVVARDDAAVLDTAAHTRSCVLLERDAAQGTPVGAFVTHLQSETPNEFHVFLSLQHATPVAVGTVANGFIWQVDGTDIRLLGRASPKPAPEAQAR